MPRVCPCVFSDNNASTGSWSAHPIAVGPEQTVITPAGTNDQSLPARDWTHSGSQSPMLNYLKLPLITGISRSKAGFVWLASAVITPITSSEAITSGKKLLGISKQVKHSPATQVSLRTSKKQRATGISIIYGLVSGQQKFQIIFCN